MQEFRRTLPMMLNYTLDQVLPVHRQLFARFDVTEQQWRVLRVLWHSTSMTSQNLSRQTLLPAPSLVGVLDRLEKKGLVSRVRSVEDRRSVYVVATAKGRALQAEAQPCAERIQAYLRSTISEAEWTLLEVTLSKITTSMEGVKLDEILDQTTPREKNT